MKRRLAVGAVMAMGVSAAALAAPPTLPTMEDITKLADAGQWKETLAAVSRVSELKGPAAAPYDRRKLLMMKAECQLQLHENSGATTTLATLIKESKDAKEAAEPIALTELLQKSPGGTYTPKGAGQPPISVLDRSKRKEAYTALATDQLAALQARVKAASNVTALPPLVQLGKAAAPVRAAEYAGTGKTEQVDAVTAQLAALSQKLMNAALGELSRRVEAVSLSANKQITVTVPMNFGRGGTAAVTQSRPTGLTSTDIATLRDVEKQCDQFAPASKELGQAFGDEKGFSGITSQATQIKSRAEAVLNANYEGTGLGGAGVPATPRGYRY
jgi:hypothetical protein